MQFSCKMLNHYLIVKEEGSNLVKEKLAQYALPLLIESDVSKGHSQSHVSQIWASFIFVLNQDKSQFIQSLRNHNRTSFYLAHLCLSSFDVMTSIFTIFSTLSWALKCLCRMLNINYGVCGFPAV